MTVELTDVTEGTLNGNGAFDKLLAALDTQLLKHLRKDDINSAQFAEIYAASMSPVLQQAIAFVLNKDKVNAEVSLIGKQEDKVDAEILNLTSQNELIAQQILKMQQEVLYTAQQVLNAQTEREKMLAEIEILGLEKVKVENEIKVSEQQILQSIEQVKLIKAQVLKTQADTALVTQNTTNAAQELQLLIKQTERTGFESALMEQKTKTEVAQINDEVDGVTVAGSIGKKNLLMQRQADGFLRDAEQKAAKIMSDLWSIEKSADPSGTFIGQITGTVDGWDASDAANAKPTFATDGTTGEPLVYNKIKDAIDALNSGVTNP